MEIAIKVEGVTPPLRRVADLGAHIKVIVAVSRSMNITATNAMLTAKQACECSRGFSAVAGQMRGFTQQLDQFMNEILSHISRLVLEVSVLSKDDRALQYIKAEQEMSHANRMLRGLAVRRREEGAQHAQGCLKEDWIALGYELHHAYLLLQTALEFAQRATVEPIYCSEMAAELKRAVGEIDAITQRVMAGVRQFSADAESA